ncbi:MAG TPA: GNAT family N-acetyltransferase [Anaerolineales bacterium]|nr:GNAT family N-acetyltransferase [Anaerolineales bacterium]HNB35228.1 GNAT family N-acetyltransferase [Anaerolineales bacterium]HNC08203.1 GNAT family N-acetyltransferase [Anaerolineales bacterium]
MKEKLATEIVVPEGFTVRGATLADANVAVEMFNIWMQRMVGQDDLSNPNILREDWESPKFDPERDIRLVFSPAGQLVGYIEVWTNSTPPVHPWIWGRVHPDFGGLGIGTSLMEWAEQHALRVLPDLPADLRFAPRTGSLRVAESSKKLLEDRGFNRIRSFYEMRIEMNEAPPSPTWSEGITLKTGSHEEIPAIYSAFEESFRDHFGHVEEPFEEGLAHFDHFMKSEGADPSMWFLAMDGDEIAGISLCRPESYSEKDMGWVNILGVRRPWRKRGIGVALLEHSFGEFYRRGILKAGLGVDAESLTGALRLYEKAGMHVHLIFDNYEKTIREGREISVESLAE